MSVTDGMWCISVLVLVLYTVPAKMSEVYRCPSGLTGTMYTYNEKCYRYVHSTVTWDVASADCSSSDGGHLVVILDQGTQNFISSLPFPSDAYQVWIGFTDKSQEQVWEWVTGDALDFTAWDDFPELCFGDDNVCPEDCAYLRTSDGRWKEGHCNNPQVKYQYICQYNMRPTTTSVMMTTTTTTTPAPMTTPSPTTTTTTPSPTTIATTPSPTTTTTTPSPMTTTTTPSPTTTTTATTTAGAAGPSVTSTTLETAEPSVEGQSGEEVALSQGGLIGLVLALILVIIFILLILLVMIRKRNRRKRYESDNFQVRFQNHTYSSNQPPSYQAGTGNDLNLYVNNSKTYSTPNIYDTPGPKPPQPCNGDSFYNGYEKPVNTLGREGQESHYAVVKECEMVDLPDDQSEKCYKESDFLSACAGPCYKEPEYLYASADLDDRCIVADPSTDYKQQDKEVSEEVQSNRSNEELLKCFEQYSKAPTAYENNLYIKDKNNYK